HAAPADLADHAIVAKGALGAGAGRGGLDRLEARRCGAEELEALETVGELVRDVGIAGDEFPPVRPAAAIDDGLIGAHGLDETGIVQGRVVGFVHGSTPNVFRKRGRVRTQSFSTLSRLRSMRAA